MNKEQIVNDIYSTYGSDSGVLFGIKERDVVKAIVEFTLNRCNSQQESTVGRQVGKEESSLWDDVRKIVIKHFASYNYPSQAIRELQSKFKISKR